MKFVGIVGTNTEDSYNRVLLNFMARHFKKTIDIEVLDINDIPMFNQSNDQTNSEPIQYLNKKINLVDAPRDLRCFVDFKILLERYFFCGHKWAKPKIIVFKEPESYLNDTWQDLYAEFVVLLQKYIIPNLIIRTENKNLMVKIEHYIKIHDSIAKVNLYEAVENNDGFNLNELIG